MAFIKSHPIDHKPIMDGNATINDVVEDVKFYSDSLQKLSGIIPNNEIEINLNCEESYNIPYGYNDGTGIVKANSLAVQTQGTAQAKHIQSGYTAYVNGNLVTGNGDTMTENITCTNKRTNTGKTTTKSWSVTNGCYYLFIFTGYRDMSKYALKSGATNVLNGTVCDSYVRYFILKATSTSVTFTFSGDDTDPRVNYVQLNQT